MMSWEHLPPELRGEGPGAFGSAIALLFIKGGAWRKIAYFAAGWALSKIFGETIQGVIGTSIDAARAVAALFGLAILEKCFDVLGNFDAKRAASDLWDAALKRIRGS
jgi:hypothetical protein